MPDNNNITSTDFGGIFSEQNPNDAFGGIFSDPSLGTAGGSSESYTAQTGIKKENPSWWENPLDWWKIDKDETQEEDTWVEDWFGKNQATDLFGDIGRAVERGWHGSKDLDEFLEVYNVENASELTDVQIDNIFQAMEEQSAGGASDEMLEFMRKVNKKDSSKTFNWINALTDATIMENPSVVLDVALSSLSGMVRALGEAEAREATVKTVVGGAAVGGGVGLAAGAIGGPLAGITGTVGAVRGGIGGLFAGINGSIETAHTVGDQLRKEVEAAGLEWNEENAAKILRDPEAFKRIKNKGIARGSTIAGIDFIANAIAPGVGSKILSTTGSKAATALGVMAVEGIGGATGEYLGSKVIGEKSERKELWLEALGELGTSGPVNIYQAIKNPPSYKIGGKKATGKDIVNFLDDPNITDEEKAKADIEVKNHSALENKLNKIQRTAYIKSTIDPSVKKQEDIDELVKLELDLLKHGNKKTQSGKNKAKEIKSKIKEITDKYAGVDKRTKEVRDKQAIKTRVEEAGRKIKLKRTESFAEIVSGQMNWRPYKAFDNNKDFVSAYVSDVMSGMDLSGMTEAQVEAKANELANQAIDSDGVMVTRNADGAKGIMINREAAGKYGALNVGSHEVLHGVLKNALADMKKPQRRKLIKDFKAQVEKNLGAKVVQAIEKRLNDNYADFIKADADWINTTDEWFAALSDIIENKDNNITYDNNKGFFDNIKDKVANIFNKETPYKKLSIDTGEDAFNFMKEYSKNVDTGKLSESMLEFAKTGKAVPIEEDAADFSKTRGKLVDDINDLQQGATTKAEFQKPSVFNKVFEAIQSGGAINNYIRSLGMSPEKTQETIDAVTDRLINFDPTAKRKDGTTIGPKGLGEFIMANVGFGKLVAAKKLAVKGEKAKRETSIDTEEAMQVADKPTTKKAEPKGQKARVLKSLADVNLDNKEIISATVRAEIDVLIEQNPKNLEEQITKLIEKEITKAVKAQMGKISNVKGEVVISDEYKAFIALNYENIVQGLDVNTIKNNYKTLFELTEIGKEDRKTRKSDKPSLKKDSNYRKGIFKIETNKAKFTKFFTEGGYTTLLARQKGLANQIAKGIIENVVSNEIIENSNNNKAIIDAKLKNYANKLNKQKNEVIGNYADQIKFSKSKAAKDVNDGVFLSDQIVKNGGVEGLFTYKNGKIKLVKNSRKISQDIVEFVFNEIYADGNLAEFSAKELKAITTAKILQKVGKTYANTNNGAIYEQFIIDVAKNIPGVTVLSETMAEGGIPDLHVQLHGKDFFVEVKMANAQYSSITISDYDIAKGKWKIKKQYEFNDQINALVDKASKGVKAAQKFINESKIPDPKTGEAFVWKTFGQQIPTQVIQMLKNKGLYTGMSTFDAFKIDNIGEMYRGKEYPVHYIHIQGKGLFHMGENPLGLPVPQLTGDAIIKLRPVPNTQYRVARESDNLKGGIFNKDGSKKKVPTGYTTLTYRAIPIIDAKSVPKSDHSIGNNLEFNELVETKEVQALKMSRSAKNKQTFNNAINFSRSAFDKFQAQKQRGKQFVKNLKTKESFDKFQLQKQKGKEFVKNLKTKESFDKFQAQKQKGKEFVESILKKPKGITVLDFDDTLATTKSLVKYTRPDGTTGTLNAEEYASTYEDLLDQGFTFDFSDFNKVVKGKIAPLFQKAIKLQGKFGPENMFVLTARPPQAAKAIFDFLKANGLNIPMKNITGLANSTAESKALWIADKVGEGFNDFYFADDALQNVQAVKNMLSQFDVKSKVQQAKVKFSKSMNTDFNNILEDVTGIESKKRFSAIKARKRGESKGKFRFFIPPSHEDFVGLLYNFIGKGKEGNAHRDFFEKALIRPLNRAYRELNAAKQSIANDYKALNKQFPDIKKKLIKKTPDGDFTYQDAIRVYLWDKHGNKAPGLSPTDQQNLVDLVKSDPEIRAYAETLNVISKQDKYIAPTESWEAGDIRTDLDDATGRIGRKEFFAEFNDNVDVIFSEENLNKIEAAYGADVVSAIKDMLYRIKTGQNRPSGQNALVNKFLNYLNGSVASTMFFNIRSAVLQQMSMVNFINFADNNIIAAAKAFANQKQYWADWAKIFNSDFMKQRRKGIQTDVNGAELAASVKNAKNPIQAAIKKLLELGFLPTQIGDNIAIATGGATFLRNRINTYLKEGMSKKEAEAKAFVDFEILAEATQQSARPDMVSQQQASPLGKVILAFQNVTSQFNRLGKKAFLDIKNRRITPGNPTQLQSDMSNLSRIAYYFAIQNLIFYSLQSALFMMMFDDNEDDEKFLKKKERIINGSLDSVLRGTGVWGSAIATLKNMAIKWHEQRDKGWNKDESAVLMEMLNVSPPLGIKARKMVNAEKTLNYNKKTIDEMETFDIDNPMWSAVTSYTEAITNVPLNRLYNKTQNVRESLNNQHDALERVLMFSGWSKWNLGVEDISKEKKKQSFGTKKKSKKRDPYARFR